MESPWTALQSGLLCSGEGHRAAHQYPPHRCFLSTQAGTELGAQNPSLLTLTSKALPSRCHRCRKGPRATKRLAQGHGTEEREKP